MTGSMCARVLYSLKGITGVQTMASVNYLDSFYHHPELPASPSVPGDVCKVRLEVPCFAVPFVSLDERKSKLLKCGYIEDSIE